MKIDKKIIETNGKKYTLFETLEIKAVRGEDYNFFFNKDTGFFARWGKNHKDDPQFSPIGNEILDLEITTKCLGVPNNNGIKTPCKFCYKSNTANGLNMSFETFKIIIDKMGDQCGQIAFGADSEAKSNPELWKMMEYCREKGIVPNITVANIDDETADKLVKYCGAVAVSRYENKNICYDSVKKLTDKGLNQVNIHMLVSEETYEQCKETIIDKIRDTRLSKLNAIVFLSLKKRGRGSKFTRMTDEHFQEIMDLAIQNKIGFGGDSCSAHKMMKALEKYPELYKKAQEMIEPCESSCMSAYVSVDGKYYPCSFCEGIGDWGEGIDVVTCSNFLNDIWNSEKTKKFRENLLKNGRKCPMFEV